ncbi:MAG: putative tellurite resistance protein B-like protein [Gammaproteobacteria bacterium]|jgi:uncharacterized tellurite resistance protein B-like protein
MFESVKHWFESTDGGSHLFDHADDESVHLALASVLYHIINAGHHETHKETRESRALLKKEFDLNDEQADYLHTAVQSANSDFEADLKTINEHLKEKPMVKLIFMQKLIQLVSIDGILDDELSDFYRAFHVIFPEIRET